MKIIYWIITGLMAAFMLLAAIPDVMMQPGAIEFLKHLGYPEYLLPFIGTAKILGILATLVPGFSRLKEWAYAGLVFDLVGALYSHLSSGDPLNFWIFPVIGLVLVSSSYVLFRLGGRSRTAE
jgi:hypothetical protein